MVLYLTCIGIGLLVFFFGFGLGRIYEHDKAKGMLAHSSGVR